MEKHIRAKALRPQRWIEDRLAKLPEHSRRLLSEFFRSTRPTAYTRTTYINAMLSYVAATDTPLEKVCNQLITSWYERMSSEGYEPGTILTYAMKLRRLYKFSLRRRGLTKDAAKAEANQTFDPIPFSRLRVEADRRNSLRDMLVTPKEFQLMMHAADHPRVRALLPILYESAARPEEVLSLRLRDIEFHEKYVQIRLKGKTGERTIPLVRSIPYLHAWIQVHPDRHNPDAPLFARVYRGKLKGISRNAVNCVFRWLCQKAGIKRHIYPYMFRHTRLTELAERDLGEYKLKSLAGWTLDSKMAARYIHLSGRSHLDSILEIEGVEVEKPSREVESQIKIRTCPRCGAENMVDAVYCNRCSLVLDERVLLAKKSFEEEQIRNLNVLLDHPLVRESMLKALKELIAKGEIHPSTQNGRVAA